MNKSSINAITVMFIPVLELADPALSSFWRLRFEMMLEYIVSFCRNGDIFSP